MWLDRSSTWSLLLVALFIATPVESGQPNAGSGGDFQCSEEGFHADPHDRMVFYRCVDFGNGSPLVKYRFVCGPGTVFSKADGDVCVHAPSGGQKVCGGTNDGNDKINDIDTNNKPGTGKEKPGVQGKPESRPPSSSPPPPPSPTCPRCDASKVPGSTGTTVPVTPSSIAASQTTAQVPTKTPVIGTQCKSAGFMADPQNCYKFYQCVDDGNGSFRRYEFTCGPGTIWDPKIDTCNHPWAANRAGCPGASNAHPSKPAPPGGSSHGTSTATPSPPSAGAAPSPPSAGGAPSPPSAGAAPSPPSAGGAPSPPSAGGAPSPPSAGGAPSPPSAGAAPRPPSAGAAPNPPSAGAAPSPPNAGAGSRPPSAGGAPSPPSAGAAPSPPSAGAAPSPPSAGAGPSPPSSGAGPSPPSAGAAPSPPSASATPSSVGPTEGTASTVGSVTSGESATHPTSQPGNGPPCTCEGFMPNPEDCTKYYRCVIDETGAYERYEFSCAEGAYWDRDAGTCKHSADGKPPAACKGPTGSTPQSSPTPQPGATTVTQPPKPSGGGPQCTVDGFLEDPEDCTKFYRCVDNGMGSYKRYEFTCAAGTIWDPIAVTCNHPWAANRVGCKVPTDSTPQSSPAPEPEEATVTQTPKPSADGPPCTCEGFMGDPKDCRKFYRCVDMGSGSYKRYEFECDADTVWDQNVLTCNHAWAANRPECPGSPNSHPSHGTPEPSEGTVTAGLPGSPPTQAPPGHGSSVAPPSGESSPAPPSGGSSAAPPSGGSSAASPSGGSSGGPPSGESSVAPPSGGSSPAPPSGESSTIPPCDSSTHVPPSGEPSVSPPAGGSSAAPPSGSSSGAPPSGSSPAAPPSGSSSGAPPSGGSSAAPPSSGSSAAPPSSGSSAAPPSSGSSAAPPSSDSSAAPPSSGSSAAPPSSGSSAAPPSSGSSAAPPSSGSSAAPPSPGSSTVAPCDGSNEIGGDSSCAKEPACGEQPNEHCSVCKEEGFFPNAKDCTKFYRCVSTGQGTYWKYEFSCGPGTAWDQSLLTCNHRYLVASCNSESSTGKPAKITTAPGASPESTTTSSSSSSSSESTTESSSESGTSTEPCDGTTDGTTDHTVTESTEPVTDTSTNSTPDFGSTTSAEVTSGESAATSTEASQATTVTEEQSTVTDSTETAPASTDHPDNSQSTTSQEQEGTTGDSGETTTSGSHEATTEVDESSTNQPPPSATAPCPVGNLTSDQIVLVCPTGFRRHPKYCNIFYQCTSDSPMDVKIGTFACPDNTIFDEKKIQCLPENESSQPCGGVKAGARVYRRVDQPAMSMAYVEQRETLCPGEGYYPYNNEECSNVFYKCKNDLSEQLRGYMYECPEGFVFSQVSRRCEHLSSLPACTEKYDFDYNNDSPTKSKLQLPTEVSNVSPRKLANY